MTKEIQAILDEDIKQEYRAGNFLPKEYKSEKSSRPEWLEINLRMSQDVKAEELESKISEFRIKLGLN